LAACALSDQPPPALEVRGSATAGRGVFTLSYIPRGSLVTSLTGEALTTAQVRPEHYAVMVGPDLWLCSPGGRLDDYLNHSCRPNTGFVQGTLELFALADIEAGNEITWDYSTAMAETDWRMECRCGAQGCRGLVLPFDELAPRERERLRPLALGWLRSRCLA
jgi:hypothetical protein